MNFAKKIKIVKIFIIEYLRASAAETFKDPSSWQINCFIIYSVTVRLITHN